MFHRFHDIKTSQESEMNESESCNTTAKNSFDMDPSTVNSDSSNRCVMKVVKTESNYPDLVTRTSVSTTSQLVDQYVETVDSHPPISYSSTTVTDSSNCDSDLHIDEMKTEETENEKDGCNFTKTSLVYQTSNENKKLKMESNYQESSPNPASAKDVHMNQYVEIMDSHSPTPYTSSSIVTDKTDCQTEVNTVKNQLKIENYDDIKSKSSFPSSSGIQNSPNSIFGIIHPGNYGFPPGNNEARVLDTSDASPDSQQAQLPHPWQCQICNVIFNSESNLRRHMWQHSGNKAFECNECGARFTQQSNLKTHRRIHTGDRPFTCDVCPASFTQRSNLRTHEKVHTGDRPHVCNVCNAAFAQASNLKSHHLTHTGARPYKCNMCPAAFVQSTHLKSHQRIHTNERPFVCTECGASFRQQSNLKTHEKTHTGEKPHACDQCSAAFTQKSNLKGHILKVHCTDPELKSRRGRRKNLVNCMPIECDQCHAQFTRASNLKIHRRQHMEEKSQQQMCDLAQTTMQLEELMDSSSSTTNDKNISQIKPYTCLECNATFTLQSNLKIHMNIHTGEKPFECPHCDVKFVQKSNLKSHIKTHSYERPFHCTYCSACFKLKPYLKGHLIKKHNLNPNEVMDLLDNTWTIENDIYVNDVFVEPVVTISEEGDGTFVHEMACNSATNNIKQDMDATMYNNYNADNNYMIPENYSARVNDGISPGVPNSLCDDKAKNAADVKEKLRQVEMKYIEQCKMYKSNKGRSKLSHQGKSNENTHGHFNLKLSDNKPKTDHVHNSVLNPYDDYKF